jgi:hypothetical protein
MAEHLIMGKASAEALNASVEALKSFETSANRLLAAQQDKRDHESALLLYSAGLVYQSMRAHAESCRTTYFPWLTYSEKWPNELRKTKWDALQKFLSEHEFYPKLQRALPALDEYIESQRPSTLHPMRARRRRVVVSVTKELAAVGGRYLHEVALPIRYQKLKEVLRYEDVFDGGNSDRVSRSAVLVLDLIRDPGDQLLDTASKAFGRLQIDVLLRHRRLAKWQPVLLQLGSERSGSVVLGHDKVES